MPDVHRCAKKLRGVQSGRAASLQSLLPKRMAAPGKAILATWFHNVFCRYRQGLVVWPGWNRAWLISSSLFRPDLIPCLFWTELLCLKGPTEWTSQGDEILVWNKTTLRESKPDQHSFEEHTKSYHIHPYSHHFTSKVEPFGVANLKEVQIAGQVPYLRNLAWRDCSGWGSSTVLIYAILSGVLKLNSILQSTLGIALEIFGEFKFVSSWHWFFNQVYEVPLCEFGALRCLC